MEIFVEDSKKNIWHRIALDDIVMCRENGAAVDIYRLNKPLISTDIAIDGFKMKYLKNNQKFLRSCATDIINKDMIVSMIDNPDHYILKMEGGYQASIRRGHEYAYFIRYNELKPKDVDLYNMHQEFIDEMITKYSDCNYISMTVFDKIGIRLTTKYIKDRYKVIKNA